MKALIITVVGIIIGLVATAANLIWLAVLAAVLALVGAYAQYRDAAPFEFVFALANWQKVGSEFNIFFPKKLHKKSNPIATVFEGIAPNFQVVSVGIKTSLDGTVLINANLAFQGKVVIK